MSVPNMTAVTRILHFVGEGRRDVLYIDTTPLFVARPSVDATMMMRMVTCLPVCMPVVHMRALGDQKCFSKATERLRLLSHVLCLQPTGNALGCQSAGVPTGARLCCTPP